MGLDPDPDTQDDGSGRQQWHVQQPALGWVAVTLSAEKISGLYLRGQGSLPSLDYQDDGPGRQEWQLRRFGSGFKCG